MQGKRPASAHPSNGQSSSSPRRRARSGRTLEYARAASAISEVQLAETRSAPTERPLGGFRPRAPGGHALAQVAPDTHQPPTRRSAGGPATSWPMGRPATSSIAGGDVDRAGATGSAVATCRRRRHRSAPPPGWPRRPRQPSPGAPTGMLAAGHRTSSKNTSLKSVVARQSSRSGRTSTPLACMSFEIDEIAEDAGCRALDHRLPGAGPAGSRSRTTGAHVRPDLLTHDHVIRHRRPAPACSCSEGEGDRPAGVQAHWNSWGVQMLVAAQAHRRAGVRPPARCLVGAEMLRQAHRRPTGCPARGARRPRPAPVPESAAQRRISTRLGPRSAART